MERIVGYFDSVVTWSVIECASQGKLMKTTIEAVYEAGVFKPLSPVENLKEHDKVRLVVKPANLIDAQRQNRIQIDPAVAREICVWPGFDLDEG
jgi:predicted DNA-binding antitoxin AbrB/MazE fold protein